MAIKHPVQRDFSGGEVSARMILREDTDAYKRSCLQMRNFIPTLQGTVQRVPGTRFLNDVTPVGEGADPEARIVPYLSTANERIILLFTDSALDMYDGYLGDERVTGDGAVVYRKQIMENPDFNGEQGWELEPPQYTARAADQPLGVGIQNGRILFRPRLYKYNDPTEAEAVSTCTVDEATDDITVRFWATYSGNNPKAGGYEIRVTIVADPAGAATEIYNEPFDGEDVGFIWDREFSVALPSASWTGDLEVTLTVEAKSSAEEEYSTPTVKFDYFEIWSNGVTTITETNLTTPYGKDDLKDLQFVQSPYERKELVVVHPDHEPHWLYFDTGAGIYKFEAVSFSNPPSIWSSANYPSACASTGGRLWLAGGQSAAVLGSPINAATETIWATEAGDWTAFTSGGGGSNPANSIEVTTIYRSPIKWIYAQKSLLVGALEMEYSLTPSEYLAPGDIQAVMHSTHGSIGVQPAGFGKGVMFAADGGLKVRYSYYQNEDQGWVSPDLTLLHPDLCRSGIKRMVRLRTPHQMGMVVLGNGQVALYHSDSGVQGWSRLLVRGKVIDCCVIANDEGVDVPFFLVRRRSQGGGTKLLLEHIPNWRSGQNWDYLLSTRKYQFTTPTNVLPDLDHLEGYLVSVVGDGNFLGSFRVTGGQVTMTKQSDGSDLDVSSARVGLSMHSTLQLLPPIKSYPGSQSRYSEFYVRTLTSTRPIINGERPADRDPISAMDRSQPVDLIADWKVATLGWDKYSGVTIEENVPYHCEIVGTFGKLEENAP